jgi:hypothetical protein
MFRSTLIRVATTTAIVLASTSPSLADAPFSVYAGPQFISQGTAQSLGGDVQGDVAVGYDFGPKTVVPVRARFDIDDSFGNTSKGRVGFLGFGASARLTTPIYAGLGFSVYSVNVRANQGGAPGFDNTAAGFGTSVFVGSKLFSVPGLAVSVEGSYKKVPTLDGIDPSAFGIGLRASL